MIVRENAVVSMGVYIGQSTPIYNRMTDETTYGEVPSGAVVIPGSLPSQDGKYSRYCALIMKQVDAKTRSKVSINEEAKCKTCTFSEKATIVSKSFFGIL